MATSLDSDVMNVDVMETRALAPAQKVSSCPHLIDVTNRFQSIKLRIQSFHHPRRDGGTGRRSGLKIRRPSGLGGSTPPPGTSSFPFQSIACVLRNKLRVGVRLGVRDPYATVRFRDRFLR